MIFVVVERITKFAKLLTVSNPCTVYTVAQVFIDNIIKLHGPPIAIVSDRDKNFTSQLWKDIFAALKVDLRYSSAYHPQSDGQTERVNQCIENYLRCLTSAHPTKWVQHLPMAEYWYNSSFHSSLKKTPFEALYGYPPPQLSEYVIHNNETKELLTDRQQLLGVLKENLQRAQERMKKFADRKRRERSFQEGDMVYLKMQPYLLNAFGVKTHIKLQSKFYGPFRVLHKVGNVAYHLILPEGAKIHPVFHVSQLKRHIGPQVVPCADLPLVTEEGNIKQEPALVLQMCQIPRNNLPVVQWLVQWANLPPEDSSWEDADFIKYTFPSFFKQTVESWRQGR